MVVVASETFSQRNQGMTIAEAVASWHVTPLALAAGLGPHQLTIAARSAARSRVRCRRTASSNVPAVARRPPPDEIAFADTIGVGVPSQVDASWPTSRPPSPGPAAALALPQHPQHRLRQRAGGASRGCTSWTPASAGSAAAPSPRSHRQHRHRGPGLPAAPSGVRTGIDPTRLIRVMPDLEAELGHQVSGQLGRAGWFPPPPPSADQLRRRG